MQGVLWSNGMMHKSAVLGAPSVMREVISKEASDPLVVWTTGQRIKPTEVSPYLPRGYEEPIRCPTSWTAEQRTDDEISRVVRGHPTPFRQNGRHRSQKPAFSSRISPLAPFLLAGGGGWQSRNTLDVRAFWPFANSLSWRKAPSNELENRLITQPFHFSFFSKSRMSDHQPCLSAA